MRKLLFICLIVSNNSFSQKANIYGIYLNTIRSRVANGCCTLIEVLKLSPNNTFSFYFNDEQGDYYTEAITSGRYRVYGDSIFFFSNPSDSVRTVTHLPSSDSIPPGVIRLTFAVGNSNNGVKPFLFAGFYSVDDSLKLTKLRVIKTFPEMKDLIGKANGEIDFQKVNGLKTFEVYLEKPKTKDIFIRSKGELELALNLYKTSLETNNLLIDLWKGSTSYYFDYSGFKFRVLPYYLKTLEPVGNVAGMQEVATYDKTNFSNFDSAEITFYRMDTTEAMFINKNRTVRYTSRVSGSKVPEVEQDEKEFLLSPEKYKQFLKVLSESSIYEPPDKVPYMAETTSQISLYFKGKYFKNYSRFSSNNLYNFLFNQLLREEERLKLK